MELDISGILIYIFALFPGFLSNELYKLIVGYHWKEDKWNNFIRSLFFSFLGLSAYFGVIKIIPLPFPIYINPIIFQSSTGLNQNQIEQIIVSLFFHFVFSTIVGILFSKILSLYNAHFSKTSYPDTWNQLCNKYAKKRWVIVGLKNSDSYAGRLELINDNVGDDERDLILEEPAVYESETKNYKSMNYTYLFLPGRNINSIGVVCKTEDYENRKTKVNNLLFTNNKDNSHEE